MLVKALLVALGYYLCTTANYFGLYYCHRPIMISSLIGLLLGDLKTGVMCGAFFESAFLGIISVGGAIPTDYSLGSAFGTAIAILSGADSATALAIATPLGAVGVAVQQIRISLIFPFFINLGQKYIDKGDVKKFERIPYYMGACIVLVPAIVVFLGVYFGSDVLSAFLANIPSFILTGLSKAGSIMPAVGIALLLNILFDIKIVALFFVGFILAKYLELSNIVISVLAIVAAIYTFVLMPDNSAKATFDDFFDEEEDNIEVTKTQLSNEDKKMLKSMKRRQWLLFSGMNRINYQGVGYAYAMLPALKRYYKDDNEKFLAAWNQAYGFFNCTFETAPLIMGIDASMQKDNALNTNFDQKAIPSLKASLMGPMSAIGDSIFGSVIRTTIAAIAISFASTGNPLGPILFIGLYTVISCIARYKLMDLGFTSGNSFLSNAAKNGVLNKLTFCASIAGMIMIGSMTAQFVNITTPLEITFSSGLSLSIQTILDSIFVGLIPLGFVFGYYALLRKKVSANKLVLLSLLIGIVGAFLGIL